MPAQKTTSGLFAKFGNRLAQAAKKAMDTPIDYGNQKLPGGITNGVAKLTKVEMGQVGKGKQNEGEYYLRMVGVIVSPKSVVDEGQEVPVEGRQTSILEMLCDTDNKDKTRPVSFEEHVKNASDEMRKLAGEDFDTEDFDGAVATLNKAAQDPDNPIYFSFSTQRVKAKPPYTEDRVYENWYGSKGLQDYVPPDAAAEQTQDDSGPAAPPSRTPPPKASPAPAAKAPPAKAAPKPAPNPDPEGTADDAPDIDALLEAADAGDNDAARELSALAVAAGHSAEAVEAAPDWGAVADMARTPPAEDGGDAGEPAADTANPKVENVFFYKPPKVKKAIECEVVKVNAKAKTCELKNLTDGKTVYKDVPFAALEEGQ